MPTGRATRLGHVMPLTLRGRRVLAVDDDVSTQELVATMLLMYGVSVRTAGRASDAIKILSEWRPDVLLTDIAMPDADLGKPLEPHVLADALTKVLRVRKSA